MTPCLLDLVLALERDLPPKPAVHVDAASPLHQDQSRRWQASSDLPFSLLHERR